MMKHVNSNSTVEKYLSNIFGRHLLEAQKYNLTDLKHNKLELKKSERLK